MNSYFFIQHFLEARYYWHLSQYHLELPLSQQFAARQAPLHSAASLVASLAASLTVGLATSLPVGLAASLASPFVIASVDQIALAITAGPSTAIAPQGSSR
jgi:hypothetical protein